MENTPNIGIFGVINRVKLFDPIRRFKWTSNLKIHQNYSLNIFDLVGQNSR
jgi:hypothetical protein